MKKTLQVAVLTFSFLSVLALVAQADPQPVPTVIASGAREYKYNVTQPFVRFDSLQMTQGHLFTASVGNLTIINPDNGAVVKQQMIAPQFGEMTTMYIDGPKVYAGLLDIHDARWAWIRILDVQTKSTQEISLPVVKNQHTYPESFRVKNEFLYVGTQSGFILVIDTHSGKIVKSIPTCGSVGGFEVTDQSIYVACGNLGVGVTDLTSLQTKMFQRVPVQLPNGMVIPLPEAPSDVVALGNFLYVSDFYHGVAVLDRASGNLLKYIQTPMGLWTTHLDIQNNKAYVSGPYRLSIFDL